MIETPSPFAPISGDNFYVTRLADGERIHTRTKEYRDWKASFVSSEPDPKKEKEKTVAGPKAVKAPKPERDAIPKPSKAQQAAEYGMLAGIFFGAFGVATGTLDYMALSEAEQRDLGGAIAGVMPTLPQKIVKQISSASPWIKLGMVGANIAAPRVIEFQRRSIAPVAPTAPTGYERAPMADDVPTTHPADSFFGNGVAA